MASPSRWIPLESNPDVMNSWASQAGLILSQTHFEDIYGLDEELLAMVPGPVLAVLLLFPITAESETARAEDEKLIKTYPVDPTVLWIKQTIGNACGTMGLIHALANTNVVFGPQSPLEKFIEACQEKTPEERSKFLETTSLFADIHSSAASGGQTAVPADLNTDLHFTCFVQAPAAGAREQQMPVAKGAAAAAAEQGMRLVELDGRRSGPIDRGACNDLLRDVAKFVKKHYMEGSGSDQFSMIALSSAKE